LWKIERGEEGKGEEWLKKLLSFSLSLLIKKEKKKKKFRTRVSIGGNPIITCLIKRVLQLFYNFQVGKTSYNDVCCF
jgi:hypothetical protein